MKLKDLIKLLKDKPDQEQEVQCAIWNKETNRLVCVHMGGKTTQDLMKVFAKHA